MRSDFNMLINSLFTCNASVRRQRYYKLLFILTYGGYILIFIDGLIHYVSNNRTFVPFFIKCNKRDGFNENK